jgi:hypothetical protein
MITEGPVWMVRCSPEAPRALTLYTTPKIIGLVNAPV